MANTGKPTSVLYLAVDKESVHFPPTACFSFDLMKEILFKEKYVNILVGRLWLPCPLRYKMDKYINSLFSVRYSFQLFAASLDPQGNI